MAKFRRDKIKRQHTVLQGLVPLLTAVSGCNLVQAILPGEINPNTGKSVELTFQYFTDTGLRLLGKDTSAVQEVFLVTNDKAGTLRWLRDQGLVAAKPEPAPPVVRAAQLSRPSRQVAEFDTPCAICGRVIGQGTRGVRQPAGLAHVWCARAGKPV